jgi:hypothetical protein
MRIEGGNYVGLGQASLWLKTVALIFRDNDEGLNQIESR